MDRRAFLYLCVAAGFEPVRALAQGRRPRIGYLLLSPRNDRPSEERQAFLDGLRSYGHVPGKNVDLVYASAEGRLEFLDEVARELLVQKVDLVVTAGAEATMALRKTTQKVPVVFLALGDPIGVGAVRSLSRPERNVTGVSFISADLAAKRMEMLREVAPAARRISILWDKDNRNAEIEANAATVAAKLLSMTTDPVPLQSDPGIDGAFHLLAAHRPDALYVAFGQGVVAQSRTAIAEFGLRQRIPIVSGWRFMTEGGGLLSYAPDIPAMFLRGAYYVDRILRGAKPADLPVEQAKVIELVVNARTARAIGINFPRSILLRADRIIE